MIAQDCGSPPRTSTIVFAGRIASVGPGDVHDVRLDNGHHITAYDAEGATARPGLGVRVSVELAHGDTRGWRLCASRSRPAAAAHLGRKGAL